ncbi:MAG TPA: cytochrome c3 family protein [Kofleriaceae bacterium]|nr:cytochrome c3 family protein [Kofleriaceae bacterium]
MRTFLVCVAFVTFVLGCSQQRTLEAPAPPIDKTRLSHSQHAQITCVECHRDDVRPGADDHAPCDRCHKDAFLGKPSELCKACHTQVTQNPVAAPLKPYPVEDVWQAEPPRFSHRLHTDFTRMENGVGFHVSCADCHVREGKLVRTNHETCSRCHAPEAKLANAPAMNDCEGCHRKGLHERARARLIKADLRFDHPRHRADRRGTPIKCEECHGQTTQSTSYTDHAPPRVENCVGCHDDTQRTPGELRMRVCQTCHTELQQRLTTIAPRNHLPSTERPLDHTLAFRRDHAETAERDSARCAACHTQMSGNGRDACDECHQTMRPQDHNITFREMDHGTEAAADRDRCARCHVVEFCTSCHSQRPRSHGFPGTFLEHHGGSARLNPRSCLTCHDETNDCLRCHTTRTTGP